jgi:hypothetical protein
VKTQPLVNQNGSNGKQVLNEANQKHKRFLIVRDWFHYVVWYVRLKKIIKSLDCADSVLEHELTVNPRVYSDMIYQLRQNGLQGVKAYV